MHHDTTKGIFINLKPENASTNGAVNPYRLSAVHAAFHNPSPQRSSPVNMSSPRVNSSQKHIHHRQVMKLANSRIPCAQRLIIRDARTHRSAPAIVAISFIS